MSPTLDDYADVLQNRCIRIYGWQLDLAARVWASYRQFLELKGALEDWDAAVLSPSSLVDQMWHQHLLDNAHYNEYCETTFGVGKIVCHDPDGGLDMAAREGRRRSTELALKARFGSDQIDSNVWDFSSKADESNPRKRTKNESLSFSDDGTGESDDLKVSPQKGESRGSLIICVWWERPDGAAPKEIRIRPQFGICGFSQTLYQGCARRMKVNSGDILISYRDGDGNETVAEKFSSIKTEHINRGHQLVCKYADPRVPIKVQVVGDMTPYEISRVDRLHELYKAVAKRRDLHLGSFRLFCHGREMNPFATARCAQLFDSTEVECRSVENWDKSSSIPRTKITIRVRDQTGEETHFKVKDSSLMYNMFDAYCERKGVTIDALAFLLDGDRIFPYDTPRRLDLEDGDQVDCFLEQVGC